MARLTAKLVTIEIIDGQIKLKRANDPNIIIESKELIRSATQPIVKWAGGKQWLASAAPHLIPPGWSQRYFEPFLGGGAFFFALEPGCATLSDCNKDLITTYRAVRDDPRSIIKLLRSYIYEKEFYYAIRARTPRSRTPSAARFLYLNRTCWNGLYRTNSLGKFNTPFGRFTNPKICDTDRLISASSLLGRVKLCVGDFEKTTMSAGSGDFAYFDPPYITGHTNNGFLKYNAQLFSWQDQERLAQCVKRLASRGVHVLLSNADHPSVLALYKGMFFYRVPRLSLIGGDTSCRKSINEALLATYPLLGKESEVL